MSINLPENAYTGLLQRDLLLLFRNLGQSINPLIFYLIVITLFPLGIGTETKTLTLVGPAIIWVAALLSSLLSLDSLFKADFDDGSLEQLAACKQPLILLMSVKVFVHWLATGLPLVLVSPVLALLFSLSFKTTIILVYTLLLGTPVLSLIGAMGAALTLSARNSSALMALIVLPMYIPVLLFATRCVAASAMSLPVGSQLLFLGALFVLALTLAPLAIAVGLKVNLN